MSDRVRVLYLAPWVDYGGSDKGTIDWFRWLDRSRFAASLITTQPSSNRRLHEVLPYADEVWALPDLIAGQDMPGFVFDFIATRGIDVVHVMNSRLGYELLPDLASLPHPPGVVVQLHVEEEDRSGYVRLVCRRYGNLVHSFSVTSEHLARAVEGYDVPPARIHVIRGGVDAMREFSPDRVSPVNGLDEGAVHVLYPGRLVEQKDPLLMAEVAERAVAEHEGLRFHVVGEGPLEPDVRAAVAARGLERHVRFSPSTTRLAGWYAACDLLLMTSRFEGVPYVAFEAMAMGLPVVAPALAGNVELLGGEGGTLVDPRDDAEAYARAILELARDAGQRQEIGRRSRERALGEFSVQEMARSHEALYDQLLEGRPRAPRPVPAPPPSAAPRLSRPPVSERPMVSVIVPCFNHGRYLPGCLAAIEAQTWPNLEVIVVDDASTDGQTREVLDGLEGRDGVHVLRMPRNGGPSRARNAALEHVNGRYMLPVDADNLLLPDAIERLVEQLTEAGARVGYIYPNLQFFGNRRDYFQPPGFNLSALLEGNFCDTCSLFDGDLFRAGLRFDEEFVLGHEDWDLVLDLAARGVHGEPARGPTLLYRKSGFTRSDEVEYASVTFAERVRPRHPSLYGGWQDVGRFGWHAGPAVSIKARSAPGVSIVALEPVAAGTEEAERLRARLLAQSCADVELLVRSDRDWPAQDAGPALRRIPDRLAATPAAALADGLLAARAPRVLITAGTGSAFLEDPGFLEKLLRVQNGRPELDGTVLCDAGEEGLYPLRPLAAGEAPDAVPHAMLLRREPRAQPLPEWLDLDDAAPVDTLVRMLTGTHVLEWRHTPGPRTDGSGARTRVAPAPAPLLPAERAEWAWRMRQTPSMPALGAGQVRRWTLSGAWMPPETVPLVRHRRVDGAKRIVSNDRRAPDGFAIEFDLGAVHRFQPPGTAELRQGGPEGFTALPDADEGAPRLTGPRHEDCLGFIDQAAFPLLDPLELAFHPPTRQWLLVCGAADPLHAEVEQRRTLGFVEAYPIHPRLGPVATRADGARSLLRTVDPTARRHRYGVGVPPAGQLTLELGALHLEPQEDSTPLWIEDGRVVTGAAAAKASLAGAARWAMAPLSWGDAGPIKARVRSAARRGYEALGHRAPAPYGEPAGEPAGYLWSTPGERRRPVYLAVHPVTGDQLLTPWPLEAGDMGYGESRLLGYVSTTTSLTGSFDPLPADVPWASRFGRRVRYA